MYRKNDNEGSELLIVEDSPTQSEKLRHTLTANGFTVASVSNALEALTAVRERPPSLVITDVVMTGMDGYELCRRLKSDKLTEGTPVILVTSLSGPEEILHGLECGADNFIRKPYEDEYLLSRIHQVLAGRDDHSSGALRAGFEINIDGRPIVIDPRHKQILNLLLSTYEEATHLSERLARSNFILNVQYRMTEALNRATREAEVCAAALDHVMEIPGVRAGWLSLEDPESGFRTADVRGMPPEVVGETGFDEDCACRRLLTDGDLKRTGEAHECPLLLRAPRELGLPHSHFCVPLQVEQRVLGVMSLVGDEDTGFTDEKNQMIQNIGNQVGTALERARMREEMRNMVLQRTFALSSEIEQRKNAQASQARLAATLETTTDLVVLMDAQGKVEYLNQAVKSLLGLQGDEIPAGVSFSDLFQDRAPLSLFEKAFPSADRDGSWRGEVTFVSREGTDVPVSLVVLSHRDLETDNRYYSAVARDVSESKRAQARIRTQLERMAALREMDIAITSSLDLRVALNILIDQVTGRLGVDAASVLVLNRELNILDPIVSRGFATRTLLPVHLGDGLPGRAALERNTVRSSEYSTDESPPRSAFFASERFASYYGVPLVARGQVNGVLEVFHREHLDPDREWLDFLEALAGQAAISVDVAQLFDSLQRSKTELSLAYDATIEGWSLAMDLRDKETEGHTKRVTDLSLRLARRLGLSDAELVQIRRGALLHDIGKMGVPDNVLLKPGKLTEQEWTLMRKHPQYAYEMLSSIRYLRGAIDIPYCHHEKWDGTGYPRGLKGEQIPISARLFAVVDVWDALRSDRPYRKALSRQETIDHIVAGSGTHFDPTAVEAFLSLIAEEDVP